MVYSSDGRTLYVLDNSGWITRWDAVTHRGQRLSQVPSPASYDCGLCPLTDGRRLLVRCHSSSIWFCDTTGAEERIVPHGFRPYQPPHIRPDGRFFTINSDQRTIGVWDSTTGGLELPLGGWDGVPEISQFDVTPDGQRIALMARDGIATILDVGSGEGRCRLEIGLHNYLDFPIRFSPDGNTLAAYSSGLQLWDVSSAAVRIRCTPACLLSAFHPFAPIFAGVGLAAGPGQALFSSESGHLIRALDFTLGRVTCAAFAPDGLTCAVGGSKKRFAVFDLDV
jgi:WD40 repeat protein